MNKQKNSTGTLSRRRRNENKVLYTNKGGMDFSFDVKTYSILEHFLGLGKLVLVPSSLLQSAFFLKNSAPKNPFLLVMSGNTL